MQTGSKHTIGYRLGIDISEIRLLQLLYQHIFKCIVLALQIVIRFTISLVIHRSLDDVCQQTGLACHQFCKARG